MILIYHDIDFSTLSRDLYRAQPNLITTIKTLKHKNLEHVDASTPKIYAVNKVAGY